MPNFPKKKKFLITCGGTREPIDPVRFIGNWSTGTIGFHLANEAAKLGADVTLICANCSFSQLSLTIKQIYVQTAQELHDTVLRNLPNKDVLIMAAAVADFTPIKTSARKIKKNRKNELVLRLKRTPDILEAVKKKKSVGTRHCLVPTISCFAAETDNFEKNALKKLKEKNLDMIVVNKVPESFGNNLVQYKIIEASGKTTPWRKSTKKKLAEVMLKTMQ